MNDIRHFLYVYIFRLSEDDMHFLSTWRPLRSLRELNLSCNNLVNLKQVMSHCWLGGTIILRGTVLGERDSYTLI